LKTLESYIDIKNIDKSDWKIYRFEKIAKSIGERVEPTNTDLEVYVGLEHLDSDSIHIKRYGKKDDVSGTKLRCYPGDVIFGRRRAYQRKAAIVEFDGFCSAHSLVLRANPDVIDPRLFPFFLHSDTFMHRAIDISVGSLSPTINWGTLKNEEFLLPPKDQQARLAKLLLAADEVVESEIKLIEYTEALYSKKLGVLSRRHTSGWKPFKLGDLLELNYGKPLKESDRSGSGYDVVSSAGVCGQHKEYLVEGPGIAVGRKGSAGSIVWVDGNFWPIDTAFWVSTKEEFSSLPLRFFYYLLVSANLPQFSIATAVPGINRNDALSATIQVPEDESEVFKIVKQLDELKGSIHLITQRVNSSKQLQKSLINQIF
jgi:type I restriction enzyme S subunit